MSDIRTGLNRVSSGREVVRPAGTALSRADVPKLPGQSVDLDAKNGLRGSAFSGNAEVMAAFTAPSHETKSWLVNPMLSSALKSVSQDVAPDGVAASPRDQYVASVIETHLAARKQLATHLNALLRA